MDKLIPCVPDANGARVFMEYWNKVMRLLSQIIYPVREAHGEHGSRIVLPAPGGPISRSCRLNDSPCSRTRAYSCRPDQCGTSLKLGAWKKKYLPPEGQTRSRSVTS